MLATASQRRSFRPDRPTNLRLTLAQLVRGRADPTTRMGADGFWRATRTPLGPATFHLRAVGDSIDVEAWGPGSAWVLDRAPTLVGGGDGEDGFEPGRHPVVKELVRRLPGLRIPRSERVVEALLPTICEQKVVGIEAKRAYRGVVRTWGEPAPGPILRPRLLLPPRPEVLAAQPSYAFRPFGLEAKRADTIRAMAARAPRLEEAAGMDAVAARRRLRAVPGVGAWSAAEAAIVALGDADAVSVGDYHLPDQVSWALAGEPRGDDQRMLELLEPFRGHRGRVIRLIELGHPLPPRYGPHLALRGLEVE